jgi:hypothetical protein
MGQQATSCRMQCQSPAGAPGPGMQQPPASGSIHTGAVTSDGARLIAEPVSLLSLSTLHRSVGFAGKHRAGWQAALQGAELLRAEAAGHSCARCMSFRRCVQNSLEC